MAVKRRSTMTQVLAGLAALTVALVVVAVTPEGHARRSVAPVVGADRRALGSMFQDDQHLIYASTPAVTRTLDLLHRLGVNQIRATVVWKGLAPDPTSRSVPRNFVATSPSAYPAGLWLPYDRLDELARSRGMTVNFNVTDPGPLWAMGRGSPSHYADHWMPSSADFGRFVQALGTRYSGRYVPPGAHTALPRISFWSIWNEPNQPGWLAPQWRTGSGSPAMVAPVLYRGYVDAAFAALTRTGHGPSTDTILVGDLAPEGCVAGQVCQGGVYSRPYWPIPPLTFLSALYCVGPNEQPLSGSAATALGCPSTPGPRAFVSAHPGLFQATGFAHHPYSFFLAPNVPLGNPAFVPLANLGRLERALDSIFAAYGVHRRLPIYLTEYGYITNPPNQVRGVSPQTQALYLNEAEYLAWEDPRVATLSQFLLYDSGPSPNLFQTGLLYADGQPKPSLMAYRLPIYLPNPALGADHTVIVWAMLRDAPRGSRQTAQVQWRRSSRGPFQTLARVTVTNRSEVLTDRVRVPAAGQLRVQWRSPTGQLQDSRPAAVTGG